MSEQAVKIAATLYKARDAMRFILGDRYREHCQFWVESINRVMQRRGCDEMHAMIELGKELHEKGGGTEMLLATYVEMIEGMFKLPAIGSVITYRQTSPSRQGIVAEGKAEVRQYLTAANAPAPHMRPSERTLYVRGVGGGPMQGQCFIVKQSQIVA